MRSRILGAFLVSSFVWSTVANADDATQELRSPLSPGTGATLEASKSKKALRLGLAHQTKKRGLYWQGALEASADDVESTPLFSLSGPSSGVTMKVGLGYSTFAATDWSQYGATCGKMRGALRAAAKAKAANECLNKVRSLATALSVPTFQPNPGDSCAGAVLRLATALNLQTDPSTLPASTDRATRRALEELYFTAAAIGADGNATAEAPPSALVLASEIRKTLSPSKNDDGEAGEQQEGCNDFAAAIGKKSDGERTAEETAALLAFLAAERAAPTVFAKISLNGLIGYQSVSYRSMNAGVPDLATARTAAASTPGATLDVALYSGPLRGGIQLGYQRVMGAQLVDVCSVVSQPGYETRDCKKAALGEPDSRNTVFLTMATALDPLLSGKWMGNAILGSEFLVQLRSIDSSNQKLLSSKTYSSTLSLPVFFAQKDAPWGLRAGLAPQVMLYSADGKKTESSILLFVGSKFPSEPGKR